MDGATGATSSSYKNRTITVVFSRRWFGLVWQRAEPLLFPDDGGKMQMPIAVRDGNR